MTLSVILNVLFWLVILLLVLEALWPRFGFRQRRPVVTSESIVTLVIKLVIFLVIWLILIGLLRAAGLPVTYPVLTVAPLGGLPFAGMVRPGMPEDGQPTPPASTTSPRRAGEPSGPPGLPYALSWWIGLFIAAGLFVVPMLVGAGNAFGFHEREYAILSIVAGVLGFVGRFFPNVQHTSAARYREITAAVKGVIPRDLVGGS